VSTYPYRQDYMHAVDVVEDFVIASGYNSFEPIMPERFTVGHLDPMTLTEDRVRETMIGLGFEEVILNILSNKADFSDRVLEMNSELLEISNPMTENYSSLRNSLLPSLLKVEAASYASMYPHKVFEVGEVVIRDDSDNQRWATRSRLGGLLAHAGANFSEMGSYLTQLQYLMFWNIKIQTDNFQLFIPGRSASIMADETAVGVIGEVHPEILDTWGIRMPTVLFEVDLSTLFTSVDG
jgi:phenylalanyl-tRNA synthetase beta chain